MKKFGFLIPILLFLGFSFLSTRLFASGSFNPAILVVIMIVMFGAMMLARPKNAAPKPASDVDQQFRGEFAKDAFSDKPQLEAKFQSAVKDYSGNMPKAALSKLNKLAPECSTDAEVYAVSMATATVLCSLGKHKEAIRHYNKAIVLHPTTDVAMTMGSCHQRLGELNRARDAYEFALDLDENFLDARSSIATTYVADGDYDTALDQALLVLEKNENHASALATAAICYGLLNDTVMSKRYQQLAVENGYNEKKITETISALKKRG